MSVDRNGRSHRPAGLPKGYAGTYDGNDAGSDAFDLQPPDPAILKRMGSHVPDPVADAFADHLEETVRAYGQDTTRLSVNRNDGSLIVSDTASGHAILVRLHADPDAGPFTPADGNGRWYSGEVGSGGLHGDPRDVDAFRAEFEDLGVLGHDRIMRMREGEYDEAWAPGPHDTWTSMPFAWHRHDLDENRPIRLEVPDGDRYDDDPAHLKWAVNRCAHPDPADFTEGLDDRLDRRLEDPNQAVTWNPAYGWTAPDDPTRPDPIDRTERADMRADYVGDADGMLEDAYGRPDPEWAADRFDERMGLYEDHVRNGVVEQLNSDADLDPKGMRRLAEWAARRDDDTLRAEGMAWLERNPA